ncbi:MAG: DNA mismatch repair endonuclease MutL [Planctomycetes bacterium]|nr:DNA mismatch repair endonuclease MutL [Planctomycetota bacterium]MCL4731154.1 DNA mismatch repair endonuclease MutL [Planctomycetota bacterium]
MGRIAVLPVEIANKIAAGEVVERPASVVKELVENAIDAGATRVDVQLVDAGKTLIRVVDDGAGIEPEDLPLALAPHATSKLATVDDLFNLGTNGFRGEALASIQSVARVRIVSQARDSGRAFAIESQGGVIGEVRQCAGAPGTSVEVRDLFYNVPARRRWLKGDAGEFAAVVEMFQAIAAANPEIAFSLRHGERKAVDLPPRQQPLDRVLALFGDRFSEGHLELHEYESYARLDGVIAPPSAHRPNSRALLLFVNRRPVKDRSLLQAVLLAYREFLPPGRYPVGVLFLTVDPRAVDVNVHPSKTEVRLLEHNRIFSLIKSAVTDRLVRNGVLPPIRVGGNTGPLPQARPDTGFEPRFDLEPPAGPPRLFDQGAETLARDAAHRWERAREVLDFVAPQVETDFAVKLPVARSEAAVDSRPPVATPEDPVQASVRSPQSLLSRARGLFQVGNTYLVVETPDGMVVIDQHAYHERILYWLLENRIASQPPERQRLLVPQPLELSLNARALADAFKDELLAFGFEVEPFGPDSVVLRAVPKYSVSGRHTEVVQELLEELAQGRTPPTPEQLRKSMVEMIACKAAIKAGDALRPEQILDLLRLGETVPHTFSCPHGRPTTYQLGFADLEKIFHRR